MFPHTYYIFAEHPDGKLAQYEGDFICEGQHGDSRYWLEVFDSERFGLQCTIYNRVLAKVGMQQHPASSPVFTSSNLHEALRKLSELRIKEFFWWARDSKIYAGRDDLLPPPTDPKYSECYKQYVRLFRQGVDANYLFLDRGIDRWAKRIYKLLRRLNRKHPINNGIRV